MVRPIDHSKTAQVPKKGPTRDELSGALTTGPAAGGIIRNIRKDYTAASLRGRVSRKAPHTSAGKADHVTEKRIFKNKSLMTLQASQWRGTAPH